MRADITIEPAQMESAAPIIYVSMEDGTVQYCANYRQLNVATMRDSYWISRMQECIEALGKATVFSTLEENSGYWQIKIDDADKD